MAMKPGSREPSPGTSVLASSASEAMKAMASISGRRILVVEDEAAIALDLAALVLSRAAASSARRRA
jgi:hypothetical protein